MISLNFARIVQTCNSRTVFLIIAGLAAIARAAGPADWPGTWDSNPSAVPSSKTVDGPLLGDGETGVVLGR